MADIVAGVDMSPVPFIESYVAPVVMWDHGHPNTQRPFHHNAKYAVSVGMVRGFWAVATPSGSQFQVSVFDSFDLAARRAQQLGWMLCPWGTRGTADCATYGAGDCAGVRCGQPKGGG